MQRYRFITWISWSFSANFFFKEAMFWSRSANSIRYCRSTCWRKSKRVKLSFFLSSVLPLPRCVDLIDWHRLGVVDGWIEFLVNLDQHRKGYVEDSEAKEITRFSSVLQINQSIQWVGEKCRRNSSGCRRTNRSYSKGINAILSSLNSFFVDQRTTEEKNEQKKKENLPGSTLRVDEVVVSNLRSLFEIERVVQENCCDSKMN